MVSLVLANLLESAIPALAGSGAGAAVGVGLQVASLGAERYKKAKEKGVKKQEVRNYNQGLDWEARESKRLIGEYGRDYTQEVRASLARSGAREGTHQYAIDKFVAKKQGEVQENIDSRTAVIKKQNSHNAFQAMGNMLGLRGNIKIRYGVKENPGYYKPI